MTIKPIDMQVNINQMHEVAKHEQGRNAALVEQQHALEKESDEKGRNVKSKIDENKKAEKTVIMREEKGSQKKKGGKQKREGKKKAHDAKDETMGHFIDIKK